MLAIILLSSGLLFIAVGIQAIKNDLNCNTEIKAIFINSKKVYIGHGRSKYAPVFRYNYGGQQYENAAVQFYSQKYVDSVYQQGKEYVIYINIEKPQIIKETKKRVLAPFVIILIGVWFFMVGAYGIIASF